jgi:multidrug efflux pump subunit AcrA (membrane-fusion protein)
VKFVVATTGLVTVAAFAMSQWHEAGAKDAEKAQPAGALVTVVYATKACFSDEVRVTGFLVPHKVAVVTADGDGYKITEVLVSEGDLVTSGQDLVRLNRPASKDPRSGSAVPAHAMTLHAPVSGQVISTSAMLGAMVSPQAGPLFQIVENNEIELEVEVPSQQMPKLKVGATARIIVDDGPERNGEVRLVGEIDQRSQLGKARLSVDKDPLLRAGMFARATVDASRSCGISVPRAAIIYQTQGTSVQVVSNNTIETRRVQLGLVSDNNVEIRDGISDGDTIVASAGTSLHDGDLVKTTFAEEVDQTQVQ